MAFIIERPTIFFSKYKFINKWLVCLPWLVCNKLRVGNPLFVAPLEFMIIQFNLLLVGIFRNNWNVIIIEA